MSRNPEQTSALCFCIDDIQSSGKADSERAAHAMADPEIQAILTDPVVRQVLTDFKENPQHAQKVRYNRAECHPTGIGMMCDLNAAPCLDFVEPHLTR